MKIKKMSLIKYDVMWNIALSIKLPAANTVKKQAIDFIIFSESRYTIRKNRKNIHS